MNATQLIRQLQKLPPEAEIIMSKDAEGNGYTPLSDICTAYYEPETEWSGELVDKENYDPLNNPSVVLVGLLCPTN